MDLYLRLSVVAGQPGKPRPAEPSPPGTSLTASAETTDEDQVGVALGALAP